MREPPVNIEGREIYLAQPISIPQRKLIGREQELLLCKAAWGVDAANNLREDVTNPLYFRLQGAPGVGKNEIVYELARQLNMELYVVQGHEEMTPEDLALVILPEMVPHPEDPDYMMQSFILQTSPLATAIYKGALFFFDEINRVPERALSPLSSVLDGRETIYSAMAAIHIGPKDEKAASRFRFCCALNPALSEAGHVLPDYIEQRTLPIIKIDPPSLEDLLKILESTLSPPQNFIDAFAQLYKKYQSQEISVRQAIALMNYAMNYKEHTEQTPLEILRWVQTIIFGQQKNI